MAALSTALVEIAASDATDAALRRGAGIDSLRPMSASPSDQLGVDAIRVLSMDAIQKANSGHPGLPLGMAPSAFVLFAKVMKHNPKDPDWPDRDRFVLSAGHGSMLLYSVLHLSGYDLSLDDLKQFRQWGSKTAGHPERDRVHVTPGVEVTTGPLGQGFANGVGMAIAERFLRDRYGKEVSDHHIYAIVSDGDMMEGIASEAASLAGHLGLGRLVYLYDDNDISLDGPTSLSFETEDVTKRFEAYGWHVLEVHDANDTVAIEAAIEEGKRVDDRPTLIRVKSIIGYPSPNKQGTSKAHGAPLGDDEVRATKEAMGWNPDATFEIPQEAYDAYTATATGAEAQQAWQQRFDEFRTGNAELAAEWDKAWEGGVYGGRPLDGLAEAVANIEWPEKIATRSAGQKVMAAMSPFLPNTVGGAADLSESTKTEFPGGDDERFTRTNSGRNVFWGVREHAMGAAVNGLAAHGGIVRPYGSTFLQFADYMRGSIRLSALMGVNSAWVFTHDSVAVGEDGPTHQPVEHVTALRAIPGLTVLRPADAVETAACWRVLAAELDGPGALVLSRQDLPVFHEIDHDDVAKGAYVLRGTDGDPQVILIGTGSEVHVATAAAQQLGEQGIAARVVSMPSWELFDKQPAEYRESILPKGVPAVSVEAGITLGWERYSQAHVGIDRFGASAPGGEVLDKLGINPGAVVDAAKSLLS